MGRDIYVYNELRRGLGPHEVVRVDCGAVALRAWGLFVDSITETQSTQSLGAAVASTGLGLRSRGRRTHPLLSIKDISGSSGAGSGLTDASKVKKRSATS